MRSLIFISLAFLLFLSPAEHAAVAACNVTVPCQDSSLPQTAFFRARISFAGTSLTGLMIAKQMADGSVRGSFTNEFGVKGFDFEYSSGHIRLLYIMPAMDRFFIRRALKQDLSLIAGYGLPDWQQTSGCLTEAGMRVLFPQGSADSGRKAKLRLSSGVQDSARVILMEDMRRNLTIELHSIAPDEK